MKRRDFIRNTSLAGAAGMAAQACSHLPGGGPKFATVENPEEFIAHAVAQGPQGEPMAVTKQHTGPGFDVHPFIKNHPDAVFIARTNVRDKRDKDGLESTGAKLSKELIVSVPNGGYPLSTKINIKPNWTSAGPQDGKPVFEKLGVNTDPHFVKGWVDSMKKVGPNDYYIRECCCPRQWEPMGYARMCEENGIDLRDLSTPDYWELKPGKDLNYRRIPGGVVFKTAAFMAPMNHPDTFLVNIAKMKSHGMGITAAIKNLQGITAHRFHQFCTPTDSIKRTYEPAYHGFFQDNFEAEIPRLWKKHIDDGIPRWARPEPANRSGQWMEQWVNRMLDSLSVTKAGLHVVEGVYSQDGNGFGRGPHPKLGPHGVTSRDYMSNVVVFGMDPFRVDIVTHWLAGHEPGNFGLFHLGIQRGMSDVLDPADIPVYEWEDGKATLSSLDRFERTPLVTYYLQRDWGGQNEPEYHLCDEPFDYSAFRSGRKYGDAAPTFKLLGRDGRNRSIMEVSVPKKQDVYVDVLNKKGELLAKLKADDLEPGVHQVVWDGFASPGLHNYYVKGMEWDATIKDVVYT